MKTMKKLLPTLAMLLLAGTMLITASYAWFTSNGEVLAEGFTVSASVPSSLQISTNSANWSTSTTLTNSGSVELTPVSSVKGYDGSFYVADAPACGNGVINTGDPVQATAVTASNGDTTYYVDTELYLMIEGEADATMEVALTSLEIFSADDSSTEGLASAYRIAIFLEDTCETPADEASDSLLYFTATGMDFSNAVYPIADTDSLASARSEVDVTDTITVGTTPTKLIVRIWLEGQDGHCYNDNALDEVEFSLVFTEVNA